MACLWPVIAALAVAFVLTWYLASPGAALRLLDRPGARSLHDRPTPRTGGVAILAGVGLALAWLFLSGRPCWPGGLDRAVAGAAIVAGVSFADDWKGLTPLPRLLAHCAAAGLLVSGPWLPARLDLPLATWDLPAWSGAALGLLFTVWMVNLYNFMDGMDGFAGGMAVMGFGALAIVGAAEGAVAFAAVNGAVAAAALGFLAWNFPPARIFMGDTGASTLGFLAAASLLWADHAGLLPLWLGVLLFSPFVIDATVTLARRALAGERVWEPHRKHFYQRLVRLGWGHRRTVLAAYLVMAGAAATALALHARPNGWAGLFALLGWTGVFASIAAVVIDAERRARPGDGR